MVRLGAVVSVTELLASLAGVEAPLPLVRTADVIAFGFLPVVTAVRVVPS